MSDVRVPLCSILLDNGILHIGHDSVFKNVKLEAMPA